MVVKTRKHIYSIVYRLIMNKNIAMITSLIVIATMLIMAQQVQAYKVGLRIDTTIFNSGHSKTVVVTGYSHGVLGFIKYVTLKHGYNLLLVEFPNGFVKDGSSFKIQVNDEVQKGLNHFGPIRESMFIIL